MDTQRLTTSVLTVMAGVLIGLPPAAIGGDPCVGPDPSCGRSRACLYGDCRSTYGDPFCGPESHTLLGRCRQKRHQRWQIDYARPYGESVHSINQAQVSKGDAAQMVLYDFDFRDGEALLNLSGLRRLDRIARMLPCNYYPIIIEGVDHDPALAAARREEVLGVLYSDPAGFPVPAERVVVADPPSPGLDGLDAVIVHDKQLGLTTFGVGPASTGFETADVPVIAPVVVGPQP